MNALSIPGAMVWLDTLLILAVQATLLAAVVWVVIKALGRWIPPSWRALLWFVVIARVLIPVAPPSAFSLQNVFVKPVAAKPAAPPAARIEFPENSREVDLQTTRGIINSTVFRAPEAVLPRPVHREINPAKALGIVWAAGAILFLALLIARSLIIRARLVRDGRAPDATILDAIEECRAQLRLRMPIRVTVSDRIAAPALTGLIPARLILPSSFNAVEFADGQFEEAREDARPPSLTTRQVISLGEFTSAQARQILLHELAHIKQGHLFLHWLALIARALQWFNPAIHFAAAGLRQECELAADAVALKNSTAQERAAYGETILQVLSHTTAPPTLLAMGMADRARHLEQRLRALNRPNRRGYHFAGILVVIAAALTGLSGADLEQPSQKIITPRENDIAIPHQSGLVNTIPNVAPTTNDMSAKRLDVLRDERVRNSPAIQNARTLIEIGRMKEAETLLKRSLEEDPGNSSAQYYLDLIQNQSHDGFRTKTYHTVPGSERFTTDIKDSFIVNDGSVPPEKKPQSDDAAFNASRQNLIRKLETIRLDAFPIPSDTDLSEVLKAIGSEIRKRDQNGHGVNLIISLGAYSLSRAVPPADVEKFKIKFDPPLRDVSVRQLFDAIVHVARPPDASPTARLKYAIEDYAVIFSEDTDEPNQKPKPVKNEDAAGSVSDANRGVALSEGPAAAGLREKLLRKLDTIRIDDFPLTTPVDLIEVVKELRFETRKLDPDHQGVNFVLDKARNRALNLNVDLDRFKIKIDPPVRDVTLRQLCEVIVRVAAAPPDSPEAATLEYAVADYGIVFSARPRESAQMISRSFRVDPNTFMQGLQGVLFSANSQNGTGANANGGVTQVETIPASLPLQERLRALMRVAGVDFPTNNVVAGGAVPSSFGGSPIPNRPQPAIFFNDRVGVLFVRAAQPDLDRIEKVIQIINAQATPNKE